MKEKHKNKIIPQAFHQASAFMAKSKGHVSLAASERDNYPFPVREQQMIANYGGRIFRSWNSSIGRRRRFNFFGSCTSTFFFFVVICCLPPLLHPFSLFLWTQWHAVCLCLRASEGVFMWPCINIPIYSPSLSYSHLFFCCDHFTDYILSK